MVADLEGKGKLAVFKTRDPGLVREAGQSDDFLEFLQGMLGENSESLADCAALNATCAKRSVEVSAL